VERELRCCAGRHRERRRWCGHRLEARLVFP
jgi:hypothetical protein